MRSKRILLGLAMAAILVLSGSYLDAQPTEPYAIGTITLTATQGAVGVGYTWGGGTLKFKGKAYDFTVKGLDVAAVGVSKINAQGDVYNLKDPTDLAGKYVAAAGGASLIKGKAGLVMKNDKGVVINMKASQPGVQLRLGLEGLNIKMK
jgi:hypothetical protein